MTKVNIVAVQPSPKAQPSTSHTSSRQDFGRVLEKTRSAVKNLESAVKDVTETARASGAADVAAKAAETAPEAAQGTPAQGQQLAEDAAQGAADPTAAALTVPGNTTAQPVAQVEEAQPVAPVVAMEPTTRPASPMVAVGSMQSLLPASEQAQASGRDMLAMLEGQAVRLQPAVNQSPAQGQTTLTEGELLTPQPQNQQSGQSTQPQQLAQNLGLGQTNLTNSAVLQQTSEGTMLQQGQPQAQVVQNTQFELPAAARFEPQVAVPPGAEQQQPVQPALSQPRISTPEVWVQNQGQTDSLQNNQTNLINLANQNGQLNQANQLNLTQTAQATVPAAGEEAMPQLPPQQAQLSQLSQAYQVSQASQLSTTPQIAAEQGTTPTAQNNNQLPTNNPQILAVTNSGSVDNPIIAPEGVFSQGDGESAAEFSRNNQDFGQLLREAPTLTSNENQPAQTAPVGQNPFLQAMNEATATTQGATRQAPMQEQEIINQLVDQARLLRNNEGSTEMVIRLKPEHLGDVTLRVMVTAAGSVTASFHSDNAAVRTIIENSLAQLRQDLANQGLKVDDVEVSAELAEGFLSQGGQQDFGQQGHGGGRGGDYRGSDEAAAVAEAKQNLTNLAEGDGVDYLV